MKLFRPILFLSLLFTLSFAAFAWSGEQDDIKAKADKLAHQFIIVDTHIDVPYRLHRKFEDISQRTEKGNFDYVRAKQGGLNAPFMSIYIPASYEMNGARLLADTLIDMVEKFQKDWPDKFAVARSPDDVTAQFKRGVISLPMGMENGAPIEGKVENIKYFYDRGIRYITLAHSKDNHISDSSYDSTHTWKGLSPFGKRVVSEMNRLGIMVDVSHITDDAIYQVLEISKAPVIASHSSCRHFTPGFERNMSDDQIKLLAKKGGVIMIAFGSSFISGEYQKQETEQRKQLMEYMRANKITRGSEDFEQKLEEYRASHPIKYADVSDVVKHIDHVVKLVGVDYVGVGSDFDGVGDSLPTGLKDVSMYPNLIAELLKLGYSDSDIQKICGGNLLRVWSQVEKTARELQAKK